MFEPWKLLSMCLILNSPIIFATTTEEILMISETNPVEMERNEDVFNVAVVTSSLDDEQNEDLLEEEVRRKPPCKVMRFSPWQFDVTDNGLFVPALNGTFTNYTADGDGNAEICYPFTDHYRMCRTWGMFQDEYKVLPNYKLYVMPYKKEYEVGEYVISDDSEKLAFVCGLSEQSAMTGGFGDVYKNYFYPTFWIISIIFLILAGFVIYHSKPKLQLSGKIQLHHIFCFTIAYSFLIIHRFATQSIYSAELCVFLALCIQFWLLATFTWMNVLAFHIWINVSEKDPATSKNPQSTRFSLYSLYAWVTPAIITGAALTLDQGFSDSDSILRPRFSNACWFNNDKSLFAFFYGPMALCIIINIVFFILTVIQIQTMAHAANMVGGKKGQLKLILMYVRLLLIMGLWWIMEVISWKFAEYPRLTYTLDTITSLYGLVIFLAYRCYLNLSNYIKRGSCILSSSSDVDFTESRNSDLPDFESNYTANIKDRFQMPLSSEKEKSAAFP